MERAREALKLMVSPIGVKEPGMIGILEPVFGRPNGHPDRLKNEQISDRWQP